MYKLSNFSWLKFSSILTFILLLIFVACKSDNNTKSDINVNTQKRTITNYADGVNNCMAEMKRKRDSGEKVSRMTIDCVYGARIPDFQTVDINGDTFNSSLLKGKLSIINFWFTTCPPCVAEIPGFNEIVEKYGNEKINYLAIGKDKLSDYKEFLEEHPWSFTHLHNQSNLIGSDFKILWGYPTTFLVDKEGVIIYGFSGGKTDETAAQALVDKLVPQIDMALK